MTSRSFHRRNPRKKSVDLQAAFDAVSNDVEKAAKTASRELTKAGIRHLLIGGLAVGAYGYQRATKDVDFLVAEEAFVQHASGIVTINPKVPIAVGAVPVDPVSIGINEEFLTASFDDAVTDVGIPIAPLEVLIYLKLSAGRKRDKSDVLELIKAGVELEPVYDYFEGHADQDLMDELKELEAEASVE